MKVPMAVSVTMVAVITFSAAAVFAQSDPIKQRQNLMKKNNDNAKIVLEMVKGQKPFDPQAVEAAFDQWADTARQLPDLFPENSKTGEDTRASPKIWEDKADFNSNIDEFAKAVADNRANAVSSLDGLKAAMSSVGKACGDCHEDYRMPKR